MGVEQTHDEGVIPILFSHWAYRRTTELIDILDNVIPAFNEQILVDALIDKLLDVNV